MKFIPAPLTAVSLLLLLGACSGRVMNSIADQAQKLLSTQTASIGLVDNSTKSQLVCAASNRVTLQLSVPAATTYYCRDRSQLIAGTQVGPVCAGGVTVVAPTPKGDAVDCRQLTICGKSPTTRTSDAKRFDGSPIEELVFADLPWGCAGRVELSKDPSFPAGLTDVFTTDVVAPTCPFCASTNGPNCGVCAPLDDQHVTAGQVIKNCTGTGCVSCKIGAQDIPHDQAYTFYSAGKNTCPKHCRDISQARVCNNGFFAGDVSFQQTQCIDAACGCSLPGSTTLYDSGQTLRVSRDVALTCGQSCNDISIMVTCTDGQWKGADGKFVDATTLAPYTKTQCSDPVCDCERAGRATVPDGTTRPVYSAAQTDCSVSCSAKQASLTCKGGKLTSDDPNALGFMYDNCAQKVCSCLLPSGGTLPNGMSTSAYKIDKATCLAPDACSAAGASVKLTCTDGVLTSFDKTVYKYATCAPPVCKCYGNGVSVDFGGQVNFYKLSDPSPNSCESVRGTFTCGTDGVLMGPGALTSYPQVSCKSDSDSGTLGGTGGGTGNDEGPGSALRKRYGNSDLPPIPPSRFGYGFEHNFIVDKNLLPKRLPCILPWAGGEIEHYGNILAFDAKCVVIPDTCTKHRQSRTCAFPTWTGDVGFKYETCVEKAACP